MTEEEMKPPRYVRSVAIEVWAHPERASFTPPFALSASPRRRKPASSASSHGSVITPTILTRSTNDGVARGLTTSRSLGYSSSNHPAPTTREDDDQKVALEVLEFKKKADLFESRAEKMKLENAGLRQLQKNWEKERKSTEKKMETLKRRITSAEEVEKATAQIPMTLKKLEDVVAGHRGSVVAATK